MPSSSPSVRFSLLVSGLLFLLVQLYSSSPISTATTSTSATSNLSDVEAHVPLPSTQKCIPEHLSALLHLKRGFNLTYSFTNLSSWNADEKESCCSWEGITCNASTGHVIGLDLSGLDIAGSFDFEIFFHLRSLERLDLSFNHFDGSPIPSGFAQLSNLTHLSLYSCNFYGQIPLDISQLTRLVSLDLSNNRYYIGSNGYLSLELGRSGLRELFRNLSSLNELQLDWVNMSLVGSQWSQILAYALPNTLRRLSMQDCGLSGPIDPSFSRLRFLTYFDLSNNSRISSTVPQFIANFTSLTSLSLHDCGLHGEFPKSIFSLPKLQYIYIYGNPFLTIYPPKSSGNSTIHQLLMSETKFDGNLADLLGNFKSLTELDLSNCSIFGPITQSQHMNFSQLTRLDLSYNNFRGPIPMLIFYLTELRQLFLSSNNLRGALDLGLFQNLKKLTELDLSNNSFSAISKAKQILSSTSFSRTSSNISQLIRLDLANNNLQGPIPRMIFELTKLNDLDLSSNHLSGVIDLGLFQDLKTLSYLDLSYNSLTIVNDARNNSTSISQLQRLTLRSCNISSFPDVLRDQEAIEYLDLSCNKISGKIPEWVWAVGSGSLWYLNLSNNALEGLEGRFPHISLNSLKLLDLSANKIKGSILIPTPSSRFFSLANNKLDGEVPPLICGAKSLEILDLSSNHFTGMIPQCLGEISDALSVLNLRKNAFHGPLLQTFKATCRIQTLDLSDNELEGEMPRSLANCEQLAVLNLGNNHFTDVFPSHLAKLSKLSVLVLRSNQFHGFIGTTTSTSQNESESQVFFPHLQIIDVSFNNFSGRLPSNLFSSWKMMKNIGSTSQFLVADLVLEGYYYQDRVMVVTKGLELEFIKILTALTVIDLSHNQFHGDIPSSIAKLNSLLVLNMSHNHFQGQIPTSLGNLKQLESLDLSQNSLSGKIPQQLSKLSFLGAVNLSENHLSGSIPQGGHFGTFQNDSFVGNLGLCGPPLSSKCKEDVSPPPSESEEDESELDFMWMGFGVGHGVGFGVFFGTMVLWRKGRHAFFEFFDRMLTLLIVCLARRRI